MQQDNERKVKVLKRKLDSVLWPLVSEVLSKSEYFGSLDFSIRFKHGRPNNIQVTYVETHKVGGE